MSLAALLHDLGPEITDLAEEYFTVFSEDIPSQNLGGIDPRATSIEVSINGRDLTILQSPSILNSSRAGGTTGAVVWKVTPLFASWITSPNTILIKHGFISSSTTVLELGSGISGIIALALSPLVGSYTLTDQPYVFKLLQQNLTDNAVVSSASKSRKSGHKSKKSAQETSPTDSNISLAPLDWELDSVASLPCSYDVIIACDCIYNPALIPPLVSTLADIAQLRATELQAGAQQDSEQKGPTIVIVAQQRRSSEVFEDWLLEFAKVFRIWRVPDELLVEGLRSGSGYLIHIGILKKESRTSIG